MTHEEITLKTKSALSASLKNLMTKKPLKKITVSEIIADCNVNRKTFYYHFEDIYALLKWTLEQEAIEVVKNFGLLIDYEEALQFVIDYVKKNTHILNCAYDSMGRDELKRFFYNDFIYIIRKEVDNCEQQNNLEVTDDFKAFICDFFTEAAAGMLINGFKNNHCLDEKKTILNITVIIDSLPDILKRAPQK